MKVYLDGVLIEEILKPGRAIRHLIERPLTVGSLTQCHYPSSRPQHNLHADVDEVRVSNVTRPEAWIKASFLNQQAAGAFLSITTAAPVINRLQY